MEISRFFRDLDLGVPVREVLLSEASEEDLKLISEIMAIGLSPEEMARVKKIGDYIYSKSWLK